ncbi:hypothetical protein P8C59_003812 [Phyllachora maydis]|uniref:Brix domain-containing protein n=1 Tax=Phyllachora maydis TaxID=1825666 RepID=A0AAD9MAQ2_9PEZI|nr:hypothetical protein P8C59_003812 [Phyllachora maydis]
MGAQQNGILNGGRSLSFKIGNKLKRRALFVAQKKSSAKARHEERHRRRKEEAKDPSLREARLARNKTVTLEDKRVYDEGHDDSLGAVVDLVQLRTRRLEEEEAEAVREAERCLGDAATEETHEDVDSMLGDEEDEEDDDEQDAEMTELRQRGVQRTAQRSGSLAPEDQKRPTGLSVIHLHPSRPPGPTLTFSISNYAPGHILPGHGNPTNHFPELLLNNFKTPLGLLVAKSFETLFTRPELQGRQVVTLHNMRDFVFVRRHRYVFREKKETEKPVVAADGKEIPGMGGIRTGLQELGPRFTLKLRRVDKGVGRAGSEGEDALKSQQQSCIMRYARY